MKVWFWPSAAVDRILPCLRPAPEASPAPRAARLVAPPCDEQDTPRWSGGRPKGRVLPVDDGLVVGVGRSQFQAH
jgi:hypothetical protein